MAAGSRSRSGWLAAAALGVVSRAAMSLGVVSFAAALPAASLLAVAQLAGCEAAPVCYEGDFIACECADGRRGFAACDRSKDAYGACGYCGAVPGAGGTESAAGSGGAGGGSSSSGSSGGSALLGFMETCSSNEECESGLCHNFNAKGPKCTQPCSTDADCPDPVIGCNNMGVCKAP